MRAIRPHSAWLWFALGLVLATSMPMSGNIKGSFVGPVLLVLLGKLYKFL